MCPLHVTQKQDSFVSHLFALVFAPSDSAFAALNTATREFLETDAGLPTLQAILSYHVGSGVYPSKALLSGASMTIPTLYRDGAAMITVSTNSTQTVVFLNEDTRVIQADGLANNGIVHVIDAVLVLPPLPGPSGPDPSIPPPPPPTPTAPPQASSGALVVRLRSGVGGAVMGLVMALIMVG